MGMTVDQTRQQRGAAEVDRPEGGGRVGLQLRRRAHFTDLLVFHQHRRGRQHIARPRIEQSGRLHQRHDRGRLGRGLGGCKERQEQCHDQWLAHTLHFTGATGTPRAMP